MDADRFDAITEIARDINEWAVSKGFYDSPRNTGEVLALIHSEVSEALEAWRDGNDANFAEELADVVIRVLDTAAAHGIDIGAVIADKMAKNRGRPYLHGRAGDVARLASRTEAE